MDAALHVPTLSRDEARSLTDEVRTDAERLWRKLVELYEGGAHIALGYSSWGSYFQTEFGGSKAYAHRLLDAGRVLRILESQSPYGDSLETLTEHHTRALAPLKNDPELLKEAWSEVTETHESPTAADVREVVQHKVGPMGRKATMNANAEVRRVHKALSSVEGFCAALDGLNIDRVLSIATDEELEAWERSAASAISALNRLRRSLKEER